MRKVQQRRIKKSVASSFMYGFLNLLRVGPLLHSCLQPSSACWATFKTDLLSREQRIRGGRRGTVFGHVLVGLVDVSEREDEGEEED